VTQIILQVIYLNTEYNQEDSGKYNLGFER